MNSATYIFGLSTFFLGCCVSIFSKDIREWYLASRAYRLDGKKRTALESANRQLEYFRMLADNPSSASAYCWDLAFGSATITVVAAVFLVLGEKFPSLGEFSGLLQLLSLLFACFVVGLLSHGKSMARDLIRPQKTIARLESKVAALRDL